MADDPQNGRGNRASNNQGFTSPNGDTPSDELQAARLNATDEFDPLKRSSSSTKEDIKLCGRVLKYLIGHKLVVVLTILFMIAEAILATLAVGGLIPILDIIFKREVTGLTRVAEQYPLDLQYDDATRTLNASGHLFLYEHVVELRGKLAEHPEAQNLNIAADVFWPDVLAEAESLVASADLGASDSEATFADVPIPDWNDVGSTTTASLGFVSRPFFEQTGRLSVYLSRLQYEILEDNDMAFRVLGGMMVVLVLLTVLKVLFAFAAAFSAKYIGYKVVAEIRQNVYRHVLSQEFAFLGRRSVGELISVITNDIKMMQDILTLIFSRFLQTPIEFFATLTLMLIISPQLTLISLGGVVPIAAILLAISRKVRRSARRVQEHQAALTIVLQETFTGFQTVKAYGMEDHETSKFAHRNKRMVRQQMKRAVYSEMASQLNEIVMTFMVIIIVMLGGYFVLIAQDTDSIEPAAYITFLIALVKLFKPLRSWSKSLVKIQAGLAGAERVFVVLDTKPEIVERPDAYEFKGENTEIHFEDITFSYDEETTVLNNVSLTVEQGQVIALVGKAGCGKSTLVNLVPRFYDPQQGRVVFGGDDVRNYTLESLRDNVAVVSQHVVIFDDTIRNNIAYGRSDIPLERVQAVARDANIHDEIMAMPNGYDTVVGGGGQRLSGGQRQRVAIARAILKDAPLLILDEATAALDVENERAVQESLERLMHGRTVLMIAHRLSTVRDADVICFLEKGQIVEKGTHESLLAQNGLYSQFHQISMAGTSAEVPAK
jgi:subfamily B ATP-binding cassette protein MsbA